MTTPDLVLVGHLAQDLQPDGAWRLGGTVTYAATLATRLGLHTGVLTSAPASDAAQLVAQMPHAQAEDVPSVVAVPAASPTIFENHYDDGRRHQFLRARAALLTAADLPPTWRAAPLVLLGPIADEIAPDLATAFAAALIAATPQGWLRQWDAAGQVSPRPWDSALAYLPHLAALILSTEDLAIAAGTADHDATLRAWAALVPHVVLTDGPRPARLWEQGVELPPVPAFPVPEVDPTGAGDCFATAFLIHLWRTGDPQAAVRYAHAAASFVVQAPGISGVPTAEQIETRF